MICPNCQKDNTENTKWCCYCGSLLELSPMEFELDETFGTPEQEPVRPAPSRDTFKQKEKASKKKTRSQPSKKTRRRKKRSQALLWILLILFILSGAFAACMFFIPSFNRFIVESLPIRSVSNGNDATGVQQYNQTDELITGFCSNWQYFSVGESEEVTFCARASIAPTLYLNNTAIGPMNDNGQNGDIRANDGIYSFKLTVYSDIEKTEHYYAGFESPVSESVVLHFFDQPTEDEKQLYLETQSKIELINAELEDDNGLINASDKENALQAVSEYSEKLLADGIISEFRVNEDNVYICFSSGLPYLYIPNVDGYLSSGDEICFEIITCQPFEKQFNNTNINDIAYEITTNFGNYSVKARPENDLVTTQMVKDYFGPNQIILWFGHGAYDSVVHSLLITGEPCYMGALYWGDYLSHRMMSTSRGKIAISSKYIDCYCKNMDNTLVYLNTCLSGKTDTLAKAFLNKGASAVVCNSETIKASYAHYIQISTMNNLQCINAVSGNYNTLSEALSLAKDEYGFNDLDYGGIGAETIIKGSTDFRLASIEKEDDIIDEEPLVSTFSDVDEINHETWSEVYENFVLNQEYLQSGLNFNSDAYTQPRFSLYDLDQNGEPELLVFNGGPSLAASTDYVFTCVSGNIKYVGNVGYRGCNLYYYEGSSYPGLFCSDGNNGVIRTTYYEMRNGSIASQDLGESETNLGGAQRFLPFYTLDEIRAMGWNEFVKATRGTPEVASGYDIISMDASQQYAINIFLSNFSEQKAFEKNGYSNFDETTDWNDIRAELITFAYLYSKINHRENVFVEGNFYTISLGTVNEVLQRFFGYTLSEEEANAFTQNSSYAHYSYGTFYFPGADGENYNYFTVVSQMEDMGGGRYRALFDIYKLDLNEYWRTNGVDSGFYGMTTSAAQQDSRLTWVKSGVAIVKPYVNNGRNTYQLDSYWVES